MITLVNARICTPTPMDGWLQIDDGLITALGPGEPPRVGDAIDVAGQWVLPGFVDTHCHGGGGAALYSGNPADVVQAARTHLLHGTTTLVASVATMRLDRMITAARAIAEAEAPNIRGIHFEGPFLSPRRRGAQTESALLTPDDSVAKLRDTDTLAGSVHFLSDALANAVRLLGLTPPHAAPLVSTNPAHHYGWQNRGTVAVGNPADLVLLSDDLTVEAVYLAGRLARS